MIGNHNGQNERILAFDMYGYYFYLEKNELSRLYGEFGQFQLITFNWNNYRSRLIIEVNKDLTHSSKHKIIKKESKE